MICIMMMDDHKVMMGLVKKMINHIIHTVF